MSPGTILAAALGLGLLAVVARPAAAHAAGSLLAAHRGGAQLWPENSLLAFRSAIALGVDFLEFDVHLSRDGQVVVIHDPTLERTTTGTGAVSDRTLAELRTLRLKGRDGKVTEELVPTLDDVAQLAAPTPLRLLLEIKVDARGGRYPGIEEKALAILDRHGMASRTIVMAFEEETVRRIRKLRPDVTVGGLFWPKGLAEARSTVEREIDGLQKLGARFIGLHQELVTTEVVTQAAKAGLLLGVWTVNDPGAMKRFIEMGVGILITDRPDVARELLRR
ncbi:MAG: glycerophosphodiester phosphodiesterase family protein [candidate division NC10 bacterium]